MFSLMLRTFSHLFSNAEKEIFFRIVKFKHFAMKSFILCLCLTCFQFASVAGQTLWASVSSSAPGLRVDMADSQARFGWELEDLFEESETFEEGSFFIWADYQLGSTLGERPDHSLTIIPPVGLHIEKHLWHNVGLRLDANLHVWEEEKVLAESLDRAFTENFEYRYWTVSLGANWHLNVGDRWDPYLGLVAVYRQSRAFCDCIDEKSDTLSADLLAGVRFFLSEGSYLNLEVGRHGVGFASLGLGLKLE